MDNRVVIKLWTHEIGNTTHEIRHTLHNPGGGTSRRLDFVFSCFETSWQFGQNHFGNKFDSRLPPFFLVISLDDKFGNPPSVPMWAKFRPSI